MGGRPSGSGGRRIGIRRIGFWRIGLWRIGLWRIGLRIGTIAAAAPQQLPSGSRLGEHVGRDGGIPGDALLGVLPADIGRLARFAATIDTAHIKNVLFIPPTYQEYLGTKEIKAIQKAVKTVFNNLAATPSPGADASASPAPQPTAKSCPP